MHRTILITAVCATLALVACSPTYQNVNPNDIGMVLTPTGYEKKIYGPGQADIGDVKNGGLANSLVLIQRSGIQVKESFAGAGANEDKEDHRCLTKDSAPMTLDVRLLFSLPDYNTEQGKRDLERIFLLGNPQPTKEERVSRISAESVYAEQAQQAVRGKIRQICANFADFDSANVSFADTSEKGMVHQIETAVAAVLKQNDVPLRLVSAFPSNMKPDPRVIDAIAQRQATDVQISNVQRLAASLDADPSGGRRLVYQMQALQDIVSKANANGHNTIIVGPGGSAPLMAR